MLLAILFLVISLIVLVKSADIFTDASERIGLYFGLSSFIVGATIVSIGSSLPELVTSMISIFNGGGEEVKFAIDNIIGSNIANIFLVAGISGIVVGVLRVKNELIDVDLPFFFISSALFILLIMDGQFTRAEGVVSLFLLIIFIFYTIKTGQKEKKKENKKRVKLGIKELLGVGVGVVGVYLGAKYTVSNVLLISSLIPGVNQSMITMLVVAVGTSLPELVVSVQAALQKKYSVALGNVFGSNTFNALGVAGIPSLFGTLKVSESAFTIGIPFLIVASLAFIFTTHDNTIKKWEGYTFLILYLVFVGKLLKII